MPYDEFPACVEGKRASVSIYFGASARPNSSLLSLYGTRMTVEAGLLDPKLLVSGLPAGPAGLQPLRISLNQAGSGIASCLADFRSRRKNDFATSSAVSIPAWRPGSGARQPR